MRERERERNWMVCGTLPRFVSDFIIMRVQAVVRRVNWKNGITSNHWPSLRRTKPRRESIHLKIIEKKVSLFVSRASVGTEKRN